MSTATVTATRAERVRECRELREQGLLLREIGERLGVAPKTAADYLNDPDGSKAHARKRRGRCVDCGTAIRSDSPAAGNPVRCILCHRTHTSEHAKWRPDRMIAAAHEWREVIGRQPGANDWSPAPTTAAHTPGAGLRRDAARAAGLQWPWLSHVTRQFGSWSAFIAACGWEPLPPGHRRERAAASRRRGDSGGDRLVTCKHERCENPPLAGRLYCSDRCMIAEKQRAYREANRDEIAEKQRAYREANRDEIAEKKRAAALANPRIAAAAHEVLTLGISQTEAARHFGVSQPSVSRAVVGLREQQEQAA